jgi:hypothetical protein
MLSLDDTCAHEFDFFRGQGLLVLLFMFDAFKKGFVMVCMVVVRGGVAGVVGAYAFGFVFTVMVAFALCWRALSK